MSNNDIFNTPEQEIEIVAKELSEIKEALRELSRKLSRIEARASRAFPSAIRKHTNATHRKKSETLSIPKMTPEEAVRFYDGVVEQAKDGNIEKARDLLYSLELPDLNLLRSELGVSLGKKKPSRRILMEAILGRVNESVMMTKHLNRHELINQADSEKVTDKQSEEETS